MKKILLVLAAITAAETHAQLKFTDSAHNMTGTVYAGTLLGSSVTMPKLSMGGFGTFRAGGTLLWSPSKTVAVFGLGALELDHTPSVAIFGTFGLKVTFSEKVMFTIGKIATPMTELRALPTEAAGQFEPWTRRQILGPTVGAKMTITAIRNIAIVPGVFRRDSLTSIEMGLRYKDSVLLLAGYYVPDSNTHGAALTLKYKRLTVTTMYNSGKNTGMVALFKIPRRDGLVVYSDIGFDPTWKMIRGEWGFLQNASFGIVSATLGVGIDATNKIAKGYVFIHL